MAIFIIGPSDKLPPVGPALGVHGVVGAPGAPELGPHVPQQLQQQRRLPAQPAQRPQEGLPLLRPHHRVCNRGGIGYFRVLKHFQIA